MNPLVSVIVPTYNVERYLEKALRSLVSQTYTNLEILVVLDGATDNSPAIAQKLAREDSRIRIVSQENGGYGKAMNRGLTEAKGDYISILEPDDWFNERMIEILVKDITEKKLPVVQSSFYFVWDKKGIINAKESLSIKEINSKYPLKTNEDERVWRRQCTIWAGLYSKEFLDSHNIHFETTPGASFQDFPFWYRVLFWADKISLLDIPLYYYLQTNPDSSIHNNKLGFYVVQNTRKLFSDLKEQDLKQFQEKISFLLLTRIDNYAHSLKHADKEKNFFIPLLREIKNDINSHPLSKELLQKLTKEKLSFYEIIKKEENLEKIRKYYISQDKKRAFSHKIQKTLIFSKRLLQKLNPLSRLRIK